MKRRSFLRGSAVAALSAPALISGQALAQYGGGHGTNHGGGGGVAPQPPAPQPQPPAPPPPQPQQQGQRIRRNLQIMADDDPWFEDYAQAVDAMHRLPENDLRSWRSQCLVHLHFCPHGASDFVAWHRHFIRHFEDICAALIGKPEFALAYWNWAEAGGRIPNRFFTDSRLNVQTLRDRSQASSPNTGGRVVNTVAYRGIGPGTGLQQLSGAFSQNQINNILRLSDFGQFQQMLEGQPHNTAHSIVGGANGHMGDFMSPLDPIFWLHHCNVDRIWAEWQSLGNRNQLGNRRYDAQFVDGNSQFRNETEQGSADFLGMNYTYANNEGLLLQGPPAQQMSINSLGGQLGMLAGSPQLMLAETNVGVSGRANAEPTRLSVSAPDLVPQLFSSRVFLTPDGQGPNSVGIENRRILVSLKNVGSAVQTRGTVVDVFVNSPDVDRRTASADHPGYAGTFSFFMAGMNHGQDFLVDVTEPLRRQAAMGGLQASKVDLQLVARIDDASVAPEATFTVGGLALIST